MQRTDHNARWLKRASRRDAQEAIEFLGEEVICSVRFAETAPKSKAR